MQTGEGCHSRSADAAADSPVGYKSAHKEGTQNDLLDPLGTQIENKSLTYSLNISWVWLSNANLNPTICN